MTFAFIFIVVSFRVLSVFSVGPETLSKAISIAIEEACQSKTTTIDVRVLSDFDSDADKLLQHATKIPIRLQTKFNFSDSKELKKCNIFAIKSLRDFENFQKFLSPEFFDFRGNFLIIFKDGKIDEINQIFNVMWRFQIINANAIFVDANDVISLATFLPFRNHKCNDTTPTIINQFKDEKFTTQNFFIEKLANLQRCPVRVIIATKSEPYIVLSENNTRISGRDISLMEELAKSLNFKINYIILDDKGFLLDNGTAGGIFQMLQNGSGDMTICDMWITRNRAKYFDAATAYMRDDIIFVIPPRAELSSFEKLIYPLDDQTWIFLIICFAIGYLVIFIISMRSRAVQNFVFGENERNPYLNMFHAFLGGSLVKVPRRNFARFILLNFLLFSMIIRWAYEGAMYQFMQSDKKYKEPETIQELIDLNYKFNVLAVSMELFEHFSGLQKRFKLIN